MPLLSEFLGAIPASLPLDTLSLGALGSVDAAPGMASTPLPFILSAPPLATPLTSATGLSSVLSPASGLAGASSGDWNLLFLDGNFTQMMLGLWVSVRIALLSMVFSVIAGVFVGVAMVSKQTWLRALMRVYLEFIRIMPQLVLLFLVYFHSTEVAGINMSGEAAAVLVFSLWGAAEMGDLVRGAIQSIPAHQFEAARALGMSTGQLQRHVVLPLATRQLIPQTVNLVTRMIKTTSIVALIGVIEILKVSQVIIDRGRFDYPDATLWIYGAVFFIYFAVCYAISLVARYLERKLA